MQRKDGPPLLDPSQPLMQRLQPFSRAGETYSTTQRLPLWGQPISATALQPATTFNAVPVQSGATADEIVAAAAAILDEEMAKGASSARHVAPSPSLARAESLRPADGTGVMPTELLSANHPALRELLHRITALQPLLEQPRPASAASSAGGEPLPTLRPAVGRAGERTSTSMALRNHTAQRLEVRLASTDLLGTVARLPHDVVEFSPAELLLEPGAEQAVQIYMAIPLHTRPGRYTGLVVASGAEETRALVVIDVGS